MHRYETGLLPSSSVDAATLFQGEAGAFLVFFCFGPRAARLAGVIEGSGPWPMSDRGKSVAEWPFSDLHGFKDFVGFVASR